MGLGVGIAEAFGIAVAVGKGVGVGIGVTVGGGVAVGEEQAPSPKRPTPRSATSPLTNLRLLLNRWRDGGLGLEAAVVRWCFVRERIAISRRSSLWRPLAVYRYRMGPSTKHPDPLAREHNERDDGGRGEHNDVHQYGKGQRDLPLHREEA